MKYFECMKTKDKGFGDEVDF